MWEWPQDPDHPQLKICLQISTRWQCYTSTISEAKCQTWCCMLFSVPSARHQTSFAISASPLACQALVSGSTFSGIRTTMPFTQQRGNMAPTSRSTEPVGVAPGTVGPHSECSQRARHTVFNPHAASAWRLYSCKWKVFCDLCSFHSVDLLYCPVGWVLDFMQHHLDLGTSPFTVKVYGGC